MTPPPEIAGTVTENSATTGFCLGIISAEAELRLQAAWGGQRIYVPTLPEYQPVNWNGLVGTKYRALEILLGEEFTPFLRSFGGGQLYVPLLESRGSRGGEHTDAIAIAISALVAAGIDNQVIAHILGISDNCVSRYRNGTNYCSRRIATNPGQD